MTPMQQMFLGGGKATDPVYLDDVFSTFLWAGDGSTTRSINNGIDMSSEGGGMTWIKRRTSTRNNVIFDTERGATKRLIVNDNTTSEGTYTDELKSFTSTGFTIGSGGNVGSSGQDYVSWTWKKQKGFFDIVKYSGNGSSQVINHGLGAMPGFIMVRDYSHGDYWTCVHSYNYDNHLHLALTNSEGTGNNYFNGVTSTTFTLTNSNITNESGRDYVAYIFAGAPSQAANAGCVDFDGTGDYLNTTSSSSDFTMGTGDFTVECWVKFNNTSNNGGIFQISDQSGGVTTGGASTSICAFHHGSAWGIYGTGGELNKSYTRKEKQWYHVAYVRHSGVSTFYVDGVATLSRSDTGNYNGTYIAVGAFYSSSYPLEGQISNFRVVKGTAVYTSAFSPPTRPLDHIPNTKLLCCNDSSVTGSTVTPVTLNSQGNPTASTQTPFVDPASLKFGENKDQGLIKCGSFIGNGSGGTNGPRINLGWEPSFILYKNADRYTDWEMFDSMRGTITGSPDSYLLEPNTDHGEEAARRIEFTATGFDVVNGSNNVNADNEEIVYMAIRLSDGIVGKPPAAATDVFSVMYGTSNSDTPAFNSGFPVDFGFFKEHAGTGSWYSQHRLTGTGYLVPSATDYEAQSGNNKFDYQDGFYASTGNWSTYTNWLWKRHKGLDVVCYRATGSAGLQIPHSLGTTPEMIITKRRDSASHWRVYHKGMNGGQDGEQYTMNLNEADIAEDRDDIWNDTAPTSTHFTLGDHNSVNNSSGDTYLATLFASANDINGNPISKVGVYAGSNSQQTITCGFQPRFVIIKNTANSDDWYLLDTLRGWSSNNEMRLKLNENIAQYSESIGEPVSTGFTVGGNVRAYNQAGRYYIFYAHK